MIFSTYKFILVFLPIVFIGYHTLNKFKLFTISKIWLIIASLVFYYIGSPDFFWFFLASVIGNYIIGSSISKLPQEDKLQRKILFAIGLIGNIALLVYYKYANFFVDNYNYFAQDDIIMAKIILPIGISFFTFQLIAYIVDSYRGETSEYDILDYLLFITFFPQLIVGPIVHHKEMVSQFEKKENQRFNWDNVARGLFLFSLGVAKKILLADPLTNDAQSFFGNITSGLEMLPTWFHSIEYTISYYFDLSGYADMAIGLGLMFNIIIPHNFNSPYKARNFQDYWKRWHMTLSRFLNNYIFRSVYKKGSKWRNYYIAVMVTFLVSGIWHGAGWTFVVWGIINGIFVCIAAWMNKHDKKFPFLLAFSLTALGIVLTRILFVSNTFGDALNVYKGLVNFKSLGTNFSTIWITIIDFMRRNQECGRYLIIGIAICWFAPNSSQIMEKFKTSKKTVAIATILMFISLINMDKIIQFLYFQF